MSEEQVRPEAVDRAVAWLAEYQGRYTDEALGAALQAQGYTAREIEAARAWAARAATGEGPAPAGTDLRGRATRILVVAFLGTWAVLSLLAETRWGGGAGVIVGVILGVALGVVLLPSLFVIRNSGRLRRGVEGAMVAILALPFLLLFIIAGACVSTTNMLGA